VEFATEEEVDAAIQAKQGTDVGGRAVMLDFTGSKAKNKPSGGGGVERGGDRNRSRGGQYSLLFPYMLSIDHNTVLLNMIVRSDPCINITDSVVKYIQHLYYKWCSGQIQINSFTNSEGGVGFWKAVFLNNHLFQCLDP